MAQSKTKAQSKARQEQDSKCLATVNGISYTLSEAAALTGLTEESLTATPQEAINKLIETNQKKQRAEKKSEYQKFCEKSQGKMADGIRHMVSEIENGTRSKDSELSTTVHNMSRRYGPVTLAVLYIDGHLSDTMNKAIENYYKDS